MKRSEAASDTSSSDAQTSKPVDKNTSQDQGPRPNETATEYAMRLEGLARGIVKPIPK
jgi:hypothetical protein